MTRSDDFGNTPWLVGSTTPANGDLKRKGLARVGDWLADDRFFLMTDALAQWFLRQTEGGRKPWEQLEAILHDPHADAAFASCIEELRNKHELHNDDVTLAAFSL